METGLAAWSDFGVAMAGATAALAGLLIVAISVNLEIIVASKVLPARAGAAIGALVLACIAACLILIPETPLWLYGIEVLVGAAMTMVLAGLAVARLHQDEHGSRAMKGLLSIAPPLVFAIGGILLVAGAPGGMRAVAAACVVSIVAAVVVAWITLIEVRR